jgi:hypothetical protein
MKTILKQISLMTVAVCLTTASAPAQIFTVLKNFSPTIVADKL